MKRKLLLAPFMGLLLLVSSNLFANSVDYSTAQSASFLMMATRQAATDAADILAYNPAGIALMVPGLHISVNNQYYVMKYEETFKGSGIDEKYKDDRPIPIFPNVYAVYNMGKVGSGNLAFGLKAGVIGGGGYLDWNGTTGTAFAAANTAKGISSLNALLATTATRTDIEQDVSSVYYGFGGSVAYSMLDDRVSLSLGGQYIYAQKTAETTGKLYFNTAAFGGEWNLDIDSKFDCDAKGYSLIFGLDVRPVDKLTLSLSYETEADLKFKYNQDRDKVTASNLINNPNLGEGLTGQYVVNGAAATLQGKLNKEGEEENFNLPAIARMGAEYAFTPALTMAIGGELFFVHDMDYNGVEEYFQKLGWELNVGGIYAIIPSKLKVGLGVTLADVGSKDSLFDSEDEMAAMGANNWSTHILMGSCGIVYTIMQDLDLVVGYSYLVTYDGPEKGTTPSGYEVSYDRTVQNIAIGVNYKVF